jgi:hypothetical protein
MSILDLTTDLFRDPASLRAFVDDPDQALQDAELDADALVAEVRHHHHETQLIEKELRAVECRPGDDADDDEPVETIHVGHWNVVEVAEKGLGDLFTPQIAEGDHAPDDSYPERREDDDHAFDGAGVDLDADAVGWGKALE